MRDTPRPIDVLLALALLTRIPVPIEHAKADARMRCAIWAYPIVGALVWTIGGGILLCADFMALPYGFGAVLALMAMIMISGALHEDGLADSFDGLFGGHDKTRRLEIMKDSRIGAFGVLALVLCVLAQYGALNALPQDHRILPLMAVGATSRLPMVLGMYALPHARRDGLSVGVGRPSAITVLYATICSAVLSTSAIGVFGLSLMGIALLTALPIALIAKVKIDGQTGDILGAMAKCSELGAFVALFIFYFTTS